MLVDLPRAYSGVRVYRGVYLAHINFDLRIDYLIKNHYPEFDFGDESYGVVDHWTQLIQGWGELLDKDPRKFVIYLGNHRKADQPEDGGWRWHKWGPYLGLFQEQAKEHEYLYDTPDVIEVWSYHIVEVNL